MPTFEYVRDERGFEILIDVSDSTPQDIQDPEDIQSSEADVLGPNSSLVNEIALFNNTTPSVINHQSKTNFFVLLLPRNRLFSF